MYLKYIVGIPSGCMLIRIHPNVSCDTLYPDAAETLALRFQRCHQGALRALARWHGPRERFFCPLEFPSVNGEWKRGWRRWQGLVEGVGVSPEFHVQHQKATGTR